MIEVRLGKDTGAKIQVDFADTAGSSAGALLPTGSAIDRLDVPGLDTIDDPERATVTSPATPFVAMIAPSQDYEDVMGGRVVAAGESHFLSRLMFMQQMHKTYAGTSTVCTGVASRLPGTIVHEVCRPETRDGIVVRFGHPAGVIETEARVELQGDDYVVGRATLGRTARRIMDGPVYVP